MKQVDGSSRGEGSYPPSRGRLALILLLAIVGVLAASRPTLALNLRRVAPVNDPHSASSHAGQSSRAKDAAAPVPGADRIGPQFPHLLLPPAPRHRAASERIVRNDGSMIGRGNAGWDPAHRLPPSILPKEVRDRASAMLGARTPDEFIRLQRQSFSRGVPAEAETVRICVLRVDFLNDTPGSKTTGDGRFDLRRDEESKSLLDPAPHDKAYFESQLEALHRYYDVMSNGWLQVTWDVWPAESDSAYHLDDTFKYGPWVFSNSNPDIFEHAIDLVADAVATADRSSPEIDFRRYQSFILWHAGSDFQSDLNQDSPWDIPSFNLGVAEPFEVVEEADTVGIDLVMVVPETSAQDGFESALNSVIAHEFGHQLFFFDLYDVTTGIPIVGAYSLMDSGTNLYALVPDPEDTTRTIGVRGTIPPSLDPWHKALFLPSSSTHLQELSDFVAAEDDSFETSLGPSSVTNDYVYLDNNLAEYYLIENRKVDLNGDGTVILQTDPETGVILGPAADSSAVGDTLAAREYDYLLPGEGILIWHVDMKAIDAGLSQAYGGINIFFSRPGVGLMEADGIRDIGTASNEFLGGPYDPYFLGGYNKLTPFTDPSSDSNDGTPSGISIAVIDSVQFDMRLKVKVEQRPGGWPVAFVGDSADQQLISLDLNDDQRPEVLVTSGNTIIGFHADGAPFREEEEDARYLLLPSDIIHPMAASPSFLFPAPRAPGAMVAAVSKGALYVTVGRFGSLEFVWPPTDSLVTSAPSVIDSLIFVGCTDGHLRGFAPRVGDPARMDTAMSSGAALLSIGVGRSEPASAIVHAQFMAANGEVGAAVWDVANFNPISWRRARGSDALDGPATPIEARPAGHLYLELDGGRHLFGWDDGMIEWRNHDGDLLPGWPIRTGGQIVGTPIVSDLDQDGVLETIAVERGGLVHAFGWNGLEEPGWPHSVWSEDERAFDLTASPRALDVNGDDVPELLIHRTDGILLAWNGEAKNVEGWPISIGSRALHGPDWSPPMGEYGPRLILGNAYGQTDEEVPRPIEAMSVLRVPEGQISGSGFFPYPAVDLERSHVYPAAWIPTPAAAPEGFAASSLNLYPNPLRGDELAISFVVGSPAEVELTAFDLSGRQVAHLAARAEPGASGTRLAWNWGRVPPGLYHVRFQLRGDGLNSEIFRKVAVVR